MTEITPSTAEFEAGWNYIQKGITKLKKILEGLPYPQFNSEEHMTLYTTIYNMCTQKNPLTKQLYDKYKKAIEEYLAETVLPSIKETYDEFILRELVKRWENHKVMVKWMSRFFTYLDRYFTVTNKLPSLHQVGMTCFQQLIYQEVHSSVKDAVIGLIAQDRKGKQIDRGLLKKVLDILVAVGTEETDYANDFETNMIKDTAAYYSRKGSKWVLKYSCPEYILKAEESLKRERERVIHYLYDISEPKLVETLETELLVGHANQLLENEQSGCRTLFRDEKVDDITRICRLYHKIPQGLELVSSTFRQHVTDDGLAIVNQATETANNKAENGADVDEQVLIRKMIELHDKYMMYVGFMNHTSFHKSLKEAFEVFCNKNVADISSAELLATFCDNILRKGGNQKLSDEAIEETLEKVVKLLQFVHDKDLFAEFYRKKLARRLLFDKSCSDELERSVLTKMKQLCGGQFTSKMEGMVMDFTLARENQAHFQEYLSNQSVENPMTDFNVTVLTTGYWPSYKTSDINLPAEMVRCVEDFKEYYHNKSQKRRLHWIYSLGHCNILGKFDSKPLELLMSTFQAVVLLLFNNSDRLSYSEIKDQSNLGDDDLVRVLFTLSCAKYKILNKEPSTKSISPTDSFNFNPKFTDKMRRIKIPLPPTQERKKVVEDVDNGRRYLVDASVVRIMKGRKILSHQELITECVDQLKNLFKPDIKLIKKRIDDLINRDYLERDQKNANTYRYVA